MAKKIDGYIKLQVPAGKANPSPPIGPALGQRGVNIMAFCKEFNAATQKLEVGLPIPVVITVYNDKSFTFIMKTPPASILLKKAAGIQKGSSVPNKTKVGKLTRAQLEEIATTKEPDLTGADLDARVRTIAGSARSMVEEAVQVLNSLPAAKFKESLDISVNLGVDPRKSDQVVRGATTLPAGTGKTVRVAVFAQGAAAEAAKEAGADIVGFDDLAESIQGGNLDFDVVIAAPDAMRVVGKLGTILGPRGLMPNPKVGTVTPDVAGAVKNAKSGQARYRVDKAGIIHAAIGQLGFSEDAVRQNVETLIADLKRLKPATSKGVYVKKITLSSTMGPGLAIDVNNVSK